MLFYSSLLALFAAGQTTVGASPAARSSSVPRGFVSARGQEFVLDGKPFYFAGANSYWISFTSELTDVSKTMDEAKAAGLRVSEVPV